MRLALLALAAGLALLPPLADASNPLASAWACTKSTVGGAAVIGQDLLNKAETIASLSKDVPQCLGQSGADQAGFAITMGAITAIKIASPSTIPNGQCQAALQNLVARPFAQGILVVMPPVPAKASLEALLKSDEAGLRCGTSSRPCRRQSPPTPAMSAALAP